MWRVIGCWTAVAALVLGTPTVAHGAPPAVDSKEAIVCQLLADCPSTDPAAAAAPETPRGGRVGNTRSFSFQKGKSASPETQAARDAQPAATGRYDLRIGFMFASAELTPSDRRRAAAFADALEDPRLADRRVRIEGHTDSVGSDLANLDLSRRRARAVGEALVAAGIDGSRLDLEGFGARRPLPGLPAISGANRRVIASLAD